jgi:hypothetical protein
MLPAIYIAGPMRGFKNLNHSAFFAAEANLSASRRYRMIYNPARMDEEAQHYMEDDPSTEDLRACLRRDVTAILDDCDAIYMLRGWEYSLGAVLEHKIAVALKLRIIYEN